MKNRKATKFIAALALVAAIGVGATLAYFTDTDAALNTVTMGHVDIDLEEPEFEKNPNNKIDNVKPNQVIAKDPTVTVGAESEDAYVRMKLEIAGLTTDQVTELLSTNTAGEYKYFDIDITEWTYSDGYFYYTGTYAADQEAGVLKAGQSVKLFENVTIPDVWGNEVADTTFTINVTAEAIQADNFNPTTVNGVYGWYTSNEEVVTPESYNG